MTAWRHTPLLKLGLIPPPPPRGIDCDLTKSTRRRSGDPGHSVRGTGVKDSECKKRRSYEYIEVINY